MRIQRLIAFLSISSSIVLAQMGGGMPGGGMGSGMGGGVGAGPGGTLPTVGSPYPFRGGMTPVQGTPTTPTGVYMRMFENMGATPMMGSGMGVGMTDDLTLGPDGTAYVIRTVASAQPATVASPLYTWQFELDAISPIDGSTKWKLPISSGRVSNPVLASDGLIYLSVDNYQMFYANFYSGGTLMTAPQAQAKDGQVLVISATNASASVMRTIQTSSDVLSAPKIAVDPAGGYMVYVLGYDMMSWTAAASSNSATFAPGDKTLYAYRSDGSLKFSVKLQ